MLGIAKDRNRSSEGLTFYWQHYGLKKDPFSLMPESSMFVNLPKFEHHMDLLLYLIRNENALLAIIGEKGCGKTSFVTHLTSQIDDAMHMHHMAADSLMTPEKLLNIICKGFGIDYQPGMSKEENLDNTIAKIQHKEKTCLLTIDDSHFLPLESLQILLYLIREQSETQMRLHIILLGDHNLQSKLSNLVKHDLLGNMIHAIELEPLTLEETKQYLRHRFNQASTTKHFPFSDSEVERIHTLSKGIPEQINMQAQQSLLNELNRRQPVIKEKTSWQKYQTQILGGSLLAALLMIVALLMSRTHIEPSKNIVAKHTEPSISFDGQPANNEVNNPAALPQQTPQQATAPSENAENISTAAPQEDKEFVLNLMNTHQNQQENPPQIAPTAMDDANKTVAEQPNSARNSSDDFITIDNHSITLKVKDDANEQMMIPAQKAETNENINNKPMNANSQNTTSQNLNNETMVQSQQKIAPTATNEKSAPAAKQLTNNKKGYTVQIIGLSDEGAVRSFIQQNHLEGQAHYFQTMLGNKPFYLLVYGQFSSEKDALNARKNLPQALLQHRPWVRALDDMSNRMKMVV